MISCSRQQRQQRYSDQSGKIWVLAGLIDHFVDFLIHINNLPWADPEGGGAGGLDPPPLKIHKNIGFLRNTGPDPIENHKATKSAFNVGPPSAHQQNAI